MVRRVAGRYALGEQLGAGGTSRVHAATDERLGRRVAVKLLDASLAASADPAGRERFLLEGPRSASFSHPNIITVFDAGEDEGDLYIVMELVEGPSLAEHLARTGPLPMRDAMHIGRQVLAGLAAAHAAGIVHRDVKPANVLLGTGGDVKLADFGIATRFDDLAASVTTVGMVIGTPRYLAPERLAGAPATPMADVYAAGVMLFEMLAGHPPFAAEGPAALAAAQRSRPAPDLHTLRADVDPALAAIVARSLLADPGERYPSAGEMAADLDQWRPAAVVAPGSDEADAEAEAEVATQLMVLAPPRTGVRGGDTQMLTASPTPPPPSEHRSARRLVVVVAALIGFGALAMAGWAWGSKPGLPSLLSASATTSAATAVTTAAPSTTLLTTTTTRHATATSSPDLIPGFPRPTTLEGFLTQLQKDPTLVGSAGPQLAKQLEIVLSQKNPKKRRDAAGVLQRTVDAWANDGSLDPTVASALNDLLAALK